MALANNEIQVAWATAASKSVAAAAAETSDAMTLSQTAIERAVTIKADNAGTPASGDTVDIYLLATCGDPDGAGASEYSSNIYDGEFLVRLNTYGSGQDPAVATVTISSAVVDAKLLAKSNAASNAIVVSACVNEKLVS